MSKQPQAKRWAIVGGGMMGMTLAYRLAAAGEQVTLLEASDHLGGLADPWTIGDVTWDRHYHVTLMSDMHLRDLLKDLELDDHLKWVETKTGFYTDGEFYSMSNSVEFLKFPPLGLIDKIRLGGTIFYASKIRNWKRLEKVLVGDWLQKWSGKRTFAKIWLPLLKAKLGSNYQRTAASFIHATIARMYAARRTGLKKEMFGYVDGGYETVIDRLEKRLVELGVEIRVNQKLESVESLDCQVSLKCTELEDSYDHTILTIPSSVVSKTVTNLSPDELRRLNGVEYQGVICASLLTRKKLGPYYVTNVTDDGVPFTGIIEMTAMVAPKELNGNHLVYLPKYVPSNDDASFKMTDEELQESFVATLVDMYPDFSEDDVIEFKVSRARQVMAVSTLNYSENVPAHITSAQGVYVVNSSQILNGTLNVNENIKLADQALEQILADSKLLNSNLKKENGETDRQLVAGSR
jgi:protoporphyrinogen oxidase